MGIDVRTSAHCVEGVRPDRTGGPRAVVTDAGRAPGRRRRARHSASSRRRRWPPTPGCRSGRWGGLVTDLQMRVFDVDGVWAAGDCVESIDRVSGQPGARRARHPREQAGPGRRHQPRRRLRDVPRRRRHRRQQGVRPRDRADRAARAGLRRGRLPLPRPSRSSSTTRAGYYPGAEPITVKLVAEQRSGRLLGGADRRRRGRRPSGSTSLAVALWNRMTVEEVVVARPRRTPRRSPPCGTRC